MPTAAPTTPVANPSQLPPEPGVSFPSPPKLPTCKPIVAVPVSAASPVYLGDGKYQRRVYTPGDRLTNPHFVGKPNYHETFTVTKVEGEYVFTRNEYSGSHGVMCADFYDRWPMLEPQYRPGLVGELVAIQRAGYPTRSRQTFTDAELRFQLRVSLARDEAEREAFEALGEDEQAAINESAWNDDRAEGWRDRCEMIGVG